MRRRMLEDATGIWRVVLACGTVNLRKGIDSLATIIVDRYGWNPFERGTLIKGVSKAEMPPA